MAQTKFMKMVTNKTDSFVKSLSFRVLRVSISLEFEPHWVKICKERANTGSSPLKKGSGMEKDIIRDYKV